MTQQQLQDSFRTLLTENPPLKEIEKLFFKALQSGALNYKDEEPDSYRIAVIIYHAILSTMTKNWFPLLNENREEAQNLKKFL